MMRQVCCIEVLEPAVMVDIQWTMNHSQLDMAVEMGKVAVD